MTELIAILEPLRSTRMDNIVTHAHTHTHKHTHTHTHTHTTSGSPQPAPLDPLAPLPTQPYFHGVISRVEAEALVETEGEFLVRESSKIPGQLVLTGKSHDGPQHLLLMDKSGRVSRTTTTLCTLYIHMYMYMHVCTYKTLLNGIIHVHVY